MSNENYGYVGKILRVDLTKENISIINTKDYEEFGGGHGIGSKLFWDIMIKEKRIDLNGLSGFDERNVVTIMTSPFTGTMVPAAGSRTEVQGVQAVATQPKGRKCEGRREDCRAVKQSDSRGTARRWDSWTVEAEFGH